MRIYRVFIYYPPSSLWSVISLSSAFKCLFLRFTSMSSSVDALCSGVMQGSFGFMESIFVRCTCREHQNGAFIPQALAAMFAVVTPVLRSLRNMILKQASVEFIFISKSPSTVSVVRLRRWLCFLIQSVRCSSELSQKRTVNESDYIYMHCCNNI